MSEIRYLSELLNGLVQNQDLSVSDLDVNSIYVGGTSGSGAVQITKTLAGYLSTATNANTPSTLVMRDSSGNFSANTITATLNGSATNITATSNSTLTTLSSLSLPTSQLSGSIALGSQVSGVLPIANGGTDNGSLGVTAGGVIYTDGTRLQNVGAGTSGFLLQSNGASAPTWVAAPVTGANTALSNLTTTSINQSLLFNADSTYTIGSATDAVATVFANNVISSNAGGGSANFEIESYPITSNSASGSVAVVSGSSTGGSSASSGIVYLKSGVTSGSSGLLQIASGGAGSGASGAITITTGSSTSGNSGNLTLTIGTAGATRGKIQLVDGSEGTSGYIWTSTDAFGSGHWAAPAATGVTSVALADGSSVPIYTISGSPVTSTGTLTFSLNSQTANTFFAAPNGSSGQPGFRSIVSADLPSLSSIYVTQSEVGAVSGVASLDGSGHIPLSQLPASLVEYQGTWDASTNTPTLSNSSGSYNVSGYFFIVSTSGTVNFGAGPIAFNAGDWVLFNGSIWEQAVQSTVVQSVNGQVGVVTVNAINQLTGDVTAGPASGSQSQVATIASNAVTNAKLAQMATLTIKGNNTGGTANPLDLTVAQVNAILPIFTTSLNGLVPASGGGTTNFLRADGTFAAPPNSGGTVTTVSVASSNGFAGTVATPTSTPVITISTSITGVLKGNGTAISAATAGTDYVIPSGSITGTASNITATSNSTLTTLSSLSLPTSQLSGSISLTTQVSGTLPVANGGTGSSTALTQGGVKYASSTTAEATTAAGTAGNVLISAGTGAPSFSATPTLAGIVNTANVLKIEDSTDNTKIIAFNASGNTTGITTTLSSSSSTSQTLTIPNITGADTLATLALAQTFSGAKTFSALLTASGGLTISGTTTNITATSQTSGTITFGGTAGTGALTFGSSTASQTTNVATGVTASASTKTVNIGSNSAAGSTTNITIGSTAGTSTTTMNGTVTLANALAIASGGTNNGSLAVTAGGVVYTDGTRLQNVGAGTSGQYLQSNGASAPTWVTSAALVNPMTTLGDIIYENATPAPARLAGNTTATKNFLVQTGTGSVSAAPQWGVLASADIPNNAANTTGTASNITATSNSTLTTLSSLSLPGSQLTNASVTSTQLATSAADQVTITGGAGAALAVVQSPAVVKTFVAGQSFSANTSYMVRLGINLNSETTNRVYAADPGSAATTPNFWAIGMASSTSAVSAGQNISVTMLGTFTLGSSDTNFSSGVIGQAVWLTTAGTFSAVAPTVSGSAAYKIGIVEDVNKILVDGKQLTGIN